MPTLILTLLLALPMAAAPDADRDLAVAKRDAAIELLEQGDYAGALIICDEALATDPTYSDAWRTRAALCLYLDDLDGAEDACRRGLALAPDDHEQRHNLGLVLQRRGELRAAAEVFDVIIAADAANLDARLQRGVLLIQLGHVHEAREAFSDIIERDPTYATAHGNRAYCHLHLEDWQAAARDVDREIQLTGGEALDWHNRGIALRRLRSLDAAVESVRRALEVDPSHLESRITLGSLLIERGALAEAVTVLEPVAESEVRAAAWLAYVDLRLADFTAARDACDELLGRVPDQPFLLWIRGLAAFAQNDRDAALADHTRAFALDPRIDDLWRRDG